MLARRPRPLTPEQFFERYEGLDGKYELVGGEVVAMNGGSIAHAVIAGNIVAALAQKLRGSGCRPFNSDTGLLVDVDTVRYPDAAIYCDPRDFDADWLRERTLKHPRIVFEVLSPSTKMDDRAYKVVEYKSLASVELIVLVEPEDRSIEVHQRLDGGSWLHRHLPRDESLALGIADASLTFAEIFEGL